MLELHHAGIGDRLGAAGDRRNFDHPARRMRDETRLDPPCGVGRPVVDPGELTARLASAWRTQGAAWRRSRLTAEATVERNHGRVALRSSCSSIRLRSGRRWRSVTPRSGVKNAVAAALDQPEPRRPLPGACRCRGRPGSARQVDPVRSARSIRPAPPGPRGARARRPAGGERRVRRRRGGDPRLPRPDSPATRPGPAPVRPPPASVPLRSPLVNVPS